jgi:hypothetical protein
MLSSEKVRKKKMKKGKKDLAASSVLGYSLGVEVSKAYQAI